jgi:hypothetical protein
VVMRTSASSGPTSGIGFSSSTTRPGSTKQRLSFELPLQDLARELDSAANDSTTERWDRLPVRRTDAERNCRCRHLLGRFSTFLRARIALPSIRDIESYQLGCRAASANPKSGMARSRERDRFHKSIATDAQALRALTR